MVIIRGTIAEVRVYETIGSLPECGVITLNSNGQETPKPEWDNHLMITGVNGGWRSRLIELPKLLSRDTSP